MKIKKRRQVKLLLLPILIILLVACEKVVFPPPTVADDVKYKTDIQAIFDAKCTSCHPPNKGLDLTSDKSYINLVPKFAAVADSSNPEGSKLYLKLTSTFHSPRTNEIEKLKIIKWISLGVPNN
jgi:hypothetical protein